MANDSREMQKGSKALSSRFNFRAQDLLKVMKTKPELWDKNHMDYKKKLCKEQAWKEVYAAVEPKYHLMDNTTKIDFQLFVSKKWANLRDSYIKSKRPWKARYVTKPYVYSKLMRFLDPVVDQTNRVKIQDDNLKFENEIDDDDEEESEDRVEASIDEEDQSSNAIYLDEWSLEEPQQKNIVIEAPQRLRTDPLAAVLTKIINKEDDDDMEFFKSMLPSVKSLSVESKLEFRIKVLQTIKALLMEDKLSKTRDQDQTSDGSEHN